MDNKMSKYIEKLRKAKGLTQKELAKQLGISNTAISKWECDCNLPDISMLGPLSKVLDADIMVLLSYLNNYEKTELNSSDDNKHKRNKIKIIVLITIILVLFLITIFLSIKILLKHKENQELESNEIKVYEIISQDERINIKGYIIFNNHQNLILINKLNYQEPARGTTSEIYTNEIKMFITVDSKVIYNYEMVEELNKKYKLSEIINELDFDNGDFYNTDTHLSELESKFDKSALKIIFMDNNSDYQEIEVEIAIKQHFIGETNTQ